MKNRNFTKKYTERKTINSNNSVKLNVDDGRIMRSWRSCLLYIGLWMHTDYVITTTHILCNIYIVIYNIYHAVTSIKAVACIKRSPFYCPVIENVI
jgi:hypothetical protein